MNGLSLLRFKTKEKVLRGHCIGYLEIIGYLSES